VCVVKGIGSAGASFQYPAREAGALLAGVGPHLANLREGGLDVTLFEGAAAAIARAGGSDHGAES
jgi:hypothetical protein